MSYHRKIQLRKRLIRSRTILVLLLVTVLLLILFKIIGSHFYFGILLGTLVGMIIFEGTSLKFEYDFLQEEKNKT